MKNACTFFIDSSTSTWEEFHLGINGAEKSRASATFSFLEQDTAGQMLVVSHLEDKVGCSESCWGIPAHGQTDRWAGPFQTCWEPVLQEMMQKTITSTIKLIGIFFFLKKDQGLVGGRGGRNEELLFNGYRVSVWENEYILVVDDGDGCTTRWMR